MSDEVEVFDGLLDDLIGAANKLGRYEELGAWGLPDLEESVKTTRVKVYKLYSEAFTRIAELEAAGAKLADATQDLINALPLEFSNWEIVPVHKALLDWNEISKESEE